MLGYSQQGIDAGDSIELLPAVPIISHHGATLRLAWSLSIYSQQT
jgi:hypothetical protein